MILCDVVQVDPQLSNSFAQHPLSGKELPISYDNIFSFVTTVAPGDVVSVPVYRGFWRAKAIYITFVSPGTQYNTVFDDKRPLPHLHPARKQPQSTVRSGIDR